MEKQKLNETMVLNSTKDTIAAGGGFDKLGAEPASKRQKVDESDILIHKPSIDFDDMEDEEPEQQKKAETKPAPGSG
jgi:hypothetical protein